MTTGPRERFHRPSRFQLSVGARIKHLLWFAHPFPDVVLIGAARAGSTAMYGYLLQHPQVRGALVKELHYLDQYWARGPKWYRSRFPMSVGSRDWVATEATPYYLSFPLAPARMAETQPDGKFLVVLRDPVDRAVSHWKFRTQRGHEKRSLAEVVAEERAYDMASEAEFTADQTRRHWGMILPHGCYSTHLERWFQQFDRERFHIVDAVDLFTEPTTTMNKVFDFIGVSHRPAPDKTITNASSSEARETAADVAALSDYYASHNDALEELLGRRFDWANPT